MCFGNIAILISIHYKVFVLVDIKARNVNDNNNINKWFICNQGFVLHQSLPQQSMTA